MSFRWSARSNVRAIGALGLAASALLVSGAARADVRHEGDWAEDPEVTLDVDGEPRGAVIKRLADATGWGIVFKGPPGEVVDVHVKKQRASKVLDVLLSDGEYVATREGTLIDIRRLPAGDTDAAEPPPWPGRPILPIRPVLPVPPVPPMLPGAASAGDDDERGNDRVSTGGSIRIEEGDVVHDVTAMGGSVDVFGTATGDVVAMGGSVRIHRGAHVHGDVAAVGGALTVEDGARVDGDVDVLGGVIRRGKDAEVHGKFKRGHRHGRDGRHERDEREERDGVTERSERLSFLQRLGRETGSAITRTALLFVFGAVLLSLMPSRMEALKLRLATRPMRSFATGVVASIAAVVLAVALCVTLVGIPFAIMGAFAAFFAVCAGLCAVLETVGGALLGHKTKSPYVHLAFGCGLFLLLSAIPFVGNFVSAVAILAGIGSVVATRAAGLAPNRNGSSGTPYRDPG